MKKLAKWAILPIMIMSLAACANNGKDAKSEGTPNPPAGTTKESEAGKELEATTQPEAATAVKSDGYEKFSQLKVGMAESEVKAIFGEPKKVDKAYYYYDINVNGKPMEIMICISTVTGQVSYFYGDFHKDDYRDEFVDAATDLSQVSDLDDEKIKTYDECVSTFKSPGYLVFMDEEGRNEYLWVASNGGYLKVKFADDGSVISYNGFC